LGYFCISIGGGRYFKLGVLNAQPIYIYTYMHGVQSTCTQHAKHAPSRGVWGHAPPENFEKIEARRWDLVVFQPLDKVGNLFIIACNF